MTAARSYTRKTNMNCAHAALFGFANGRGAFLHSRKHFKSAVFSSPQVNFFVIWRYTNIVKTIVWPPQAKILGIWRHKNILNTVFWPPQAKILGIWRHENAKNVCILARRRRKILARFWHNYKNTPLPYKNTPPPKVQESLEGGILIGAKSKTRRRWKFWD